MEGFFCLFLLFVWVFWGDFFCLFLVGFVLVFFLILYELPGALSALLLLRLLHGLL